MCTLDIRNCFLKISDNLDNLYSLNLDPLLLMCLTKEFSSIQWELTVVHPFFILVVNTGHWETRLEGWGWGVVSFSGFFKTVLFWELSMALALITAGSIFHVRGSREQALNPVLYVLSRDPCSPLPGKKLSVPLLSFAPPFCVHPLAPFLPNREEQNVCSLRLFVEAALF